MYIISQTRYKEHFKRGPYKYIPDCLLAKYRPRIIDNIIKGEEVVGPIVGINIKKVDLSIESNMDEFVENILKLKSEEDTKLYMEGLENIDDNILNELELRTSMLIPKGKDIWQYNLPIVLKQLFKSLKEDSFQEEVLIICGEKEQSIQLIKSLSEFLGFISIIGNNENVLEDIYGQILEETGVSLFQPTNIEKTIKKYNIIINLCEDLSFSLVNLRRKAILFDMSNSKKISKLGEEFKNTILINDINLSIKDTEIVSNQWLGPIVSPGLYEFLMGDQKKEFYKIKWNGQYYFLKDFINSAIKLKGNI